jgi:hypothetical protein
VNPEIGTDLLQRDTGLAAASDVHDVLAELLGKRLRHSNILPARPSAKRSQTSQIVQQAHTSKPDICIEQFALLEFIMNSVHRPRSCEGTRTRPMNGTAPGGDQLSLRMSDVPR